MSFTISLMNIFISEAKGIKTKYLLAVCPQHPNGYQNNEFVRFVDIPAKRFVVYVVFGQNKLVNSLY